MARIENTTPHNIEPVIKGERLVIPRGSIPGLGDPNGFVEVSDEVLAALNSEEWFQVAVGRGELLVVDSAVASKDDKPKGKK